MGIKIMQSSSWYVLWVLQVRDVSPLLLSYLPSYGYIGARTYLPECISHGGLLHIHRWSSGCWSDCSFHTCGGSTWGTQAGCHLYSGKEGDVIIHRIVSSFWRPSQSPLSFYLLHADSHFSLRSCHLIWRCWQVSLRRDRLVVYYIFLLISVESI